MNPKDYQNQAQYRDQGCTAGPCEPTRVEVPHFDGDIYYLARRHQLSISVLEDIQELINYRVEKIVGAVRNNK